MNSIVRVSCGSYKFKQEEDFKPCIIITNFENIKIIDCKILQIIDNPYIFVTQDHNGCFNYIDKK